MPRLPSAFATVSHSTAREIGSVLAAVRLVLDRLLTSHPTTTTVCANVYPSATKHCVELTDASRRTLAAIVLLELLVALLGIMLVHRVVGWWMQRADSDGESLKMPTRDAQAAPRLPRLPYIPGK
ncbi:hypothetical protein C8F01DRAFT_290704 [Mycena amicta]|nr:hypothetical protein C8F01DRAFT_290704 [Mycena amicta]